MTQQAKRRRIPERRDMDQERNTYKEYRFLSADDAQNLASHPQYSAWVSASAGTGKTKVLTDRVLRLLLPREKGQEGTPARRLVCLTFTKAAANEMAVRITKTLGFWSVMEDGLLQGALERLLGYVPSQIHIEASRRLFAEVVDSSGGLPIMTIHAFCQSVLGRFPLEAGVPTDFRVIDEGQARELMRRAIAQMIKDAQDPERSGSLLSEAFYDLSVVLSLESLSMQIVQMSKEKSQISELLQKYHNAEGLYAVICNFYGIAPGLTEEKLVKAFSEDGQFDRKGLKEAAELLVADKGLKAKEKGGFILDWLGANLKGRGEKFLQYRRSFLTTKDTIYKAAFPPAGIDKKFPHVSNVLHKEADRVLKLADAIKCVKSAKMTKDIFIVAQDVLKNYEHIKQKQGCLDYDDLIDRTMRLLTGCTDAFEKLNSEKRTQALPWVLYKLDQGIDHILIDEAQDTNPEQWRIIETLSDDFFSGLGAREDLARTYFTVGDIKQSIYGFQRAAPDEFKRMEAVFDQKIKRAGQVNNIVPLDISFRSTESILRVVDHVFADKKSRAALGETNIQHRAYRKGQEGLVELWPVFETIKPEKGDPWKPAGHVKVHNSGAEDMARFIAQKVKNWTAGNEILKGRERAIEPKDIMILVRSRTGIVEHLIRALKAQGVPVSGADRMIVSDQLAVQDLISLARFCLLPDDDLTLAEVLKSPLIGCSEDELFALSYNRQGTLWQELCQPDWSRLKELAGDVTLPDKDGLNDVRFYLLQMIGRVRTLNSYEFFSRILSEACPADSYSGMRAMCKRLGEEVFDPIDELLTMALDFTYEHADHVQKFLDEQERIRKEIKRETEDADNKVRIMTIHGSKGLQSPIVILPDTMQKRRQQNRDNLLWPAKTGLDVPLYSVNVNSMPQAYVSYRDERSFAEEEEEQRLLYVAMTRAADRLYVTGYTGVAKEQHEGWYNQIETAMRSDKAVKLLDTPEGEVLCIENSQSAEPDKTEGKVEKTGTVPEVASWVFERPKAEPIPPKPLVPSRPSRDEETQDRALSPLKGAQNKRFVRGNITHKLLEFLPDYAQQKHQEMAEYFVNKNAADLSKSVRKSIVEEVCAILANSEYKDFFAKGSLAEVPVIALMPDNKVISGQIDRLVIGKEDIWIVDYKTNRSSPREEEGVPQIYLDQLKAYRDVVQGIYPEHKIHCALLWTDEPCMMKLDI